LSFFRGCDKRQELAATGATAAMLAPRTSPVPLPAEFDLAVATAYACACTRKARDQLTVRDLAQARAQALRDRQDEVVLALDLLIEFRSLRDLYCDRR
jgi:hypothetical protein